MSLPITAIESMVSTGHATRFNENINALSAGTLFGMRPSRCVGLDFTVYGGVFTSSAGVISVLPDQEIQLTPSATNYVYVDPAGIVGSTTVIPTGWPGPITVGTALYALVVGTDAITSGTAYLTGRKTTGPQGPQGPTGSPGSPFWKQRKRILQVNGDTSIFAGTPPGFDYTAIGSTFSSPALLSTSFFGSIPSVRCSAGERSTTNLFCGTRGGELTIRFGLDVNTSFTPANHRFFAGLYDITPGSPSPATGATAQEPSTFLNIAGVGGDSGDTVIHAMCNDGSGTATKTSLGSSFPSKPAGMGGAGKIYDLRLEWEAGVSEIAYSLTNAEAAVETTGTFTTNLPALTQFLGFIVWGTGTSDAVAGIFLCQLTANSRF